jgi:hypothetical protein
MSIAQRCISVLLIVLVTGFMAVVVVPRPASGAPSSAPQSVVVTNNSAQQVPVILASLPAISGNVAATQSGAWTVGISGTPSMNITNLPGAPVPVRDVDLSSRIQLNGSTNGDQAASPYILLFFDQLPPVNILLDHVSYSCRSDNTTPMVRAILGTTIDAGHDYLPVADAVPLPGAFAGAAFNVNTSASLSVSGGGTPYLQLILASNGGLDCVASLSGHRLP